jgi:hypothetical protein
MPVAAMSRPESPRLSCLSLSVPQTPEARFWIASCLPTIWELDRSLKQYRVYLYKSELSANGKTSYNPLTLACL